MLMFQKNTKYKPDPKLGSWVNMQRKRAKSNDLNENQVNRLNAIGFEWVLKRGGFNSVVN